MNSGIRLNPFWLQSELGGELRKASKELLKNWTDLHSSPPTILFHYTTSQGLIGILRSNRLWATHVGFLNDASEVAYADRIIKEFLKESARAATHPVLQEFYKRCLLAIDPFTGFRRYYVTCFCETGDLLSQWSSYADAGGGYSLGLSAKEIGRRPRKDHNFFLRKVVYDRKVQRTLVETTISRAVEILKKAPKEQTVVQATHMIASAVHFLDDHLAEFFCTFKDPAFESEQEWRLVLEILVTELEIQNKRPKFRISRGHIVPYYELDVSPFAGVNSGKVPLSTVIYGPTLDKNMTESALKLLLKKYNYPFVQVCRSVVPLRG